MGKFDKYKIDLKGMQENTAQYEFLLDNTFFTNIDGPEVQKGKVNVTLNVKKTAGTYELNFVTEGVVLVPCDRCLDEMEIPVTSTDQLYVKLGETFAEEKGNIVVIPEEEGEINVAWFMYEFVALSVPMKHIHAPGRCNKTMTKKLSKHLKTTDDDEMDSDTLDLSVDDEEVVEVEKEIDPRWNDLKKILDNN